MSEGRQHAPVEPGDDEVPTTAAGGGDGSRRRTLIVLGVVAVLMAGLVFLLATGGGDDDGTADTGALVVGEEAPPLVGATTAGGELDLTELRGRWVVVNFFATWCPPCVAEHPELVAFSERDDVAVVSVAFDEPPEVIEEFFAQNGGDWDVVAEDTGDIVLDWGVVKLPESFLVDPDGRVVEKLEGGVTAAGLDARIDEAS